MEKWTELEYDCTLEKSIVPVVNFLKLPFSPLSHPGCSGGEPLPATLSGEGGRSSPEASEFSLLTLAVADQTQTKRSQKCIIVMNVQRVGISADEQNTTFFSFVK